MAMLAHHQGLVRGSEPTPEAGITVMDRGLGGRRGDTTRCSQRRAMTPYFEYQPSWRDPESMEDEEAPVDVDLGAPPELGLEVDHFLQGSAKSLEEEDRKAPSPEHPG